MRTLFDGHAILKGIAPVNAAARRRLVPPRRRRPRAGSVRRHNFPARPQRSRTQLTLLQCLHLDSNTQDNVSCRKRMSRDHYRTGGPVWSSWWRLL